MATIKGMGWRPDVPDMRDLILPKASGEIDKALPAMVDLSVDPAMPPIWDQGEIGSCTANASSAAVEFLQRKNKAIWDFMPSRLFVYYNSRLPLGMTNVDSGAYVRDAIKSINIYGVCREDVWVYDEKKFKQKPLASAYKNATLHKALKYLRIPRDINTMKGILASGLPFVFGFSTYQTFMSDEVEKTGILPMPLANEKMTGGHCVLCVGYRDDTQQVIIRNSWGPDWGQKGYFLMPYEYITKSGLADDFWVITDISGD